MFYKHLPQVFNFFKTHIDLQYPLYDGEDDPMERTREAHESFMKSRGEMVLGRAGILKDVIMKAFEYYSHFDTPLYINQQVLTKAYSPHDVR